MVVQIFFQYSVPSIRVQPIILHLWKSLKLTEHVHSNKQGEDGK